MDIELTLNGNPIPASRPRLSYKTGQVYHEQKYKRFKKRLADAIKFRFGHLAADVPDKKESALRKKYLKHVRFGLLVIIVPESGQHRGDWDNYGKTVSDAIEDSGIIANDKQIVEAWISVREPDKDNPHLYFRLFKLEKLSVLKQVQIKFREMFLHIQNFIIRKPKIQTGKGN